MNKNPIVPSSFCEDESKVRFELKNNPVDAQNYDYCSQRSYLTKPNNLKESVIHMLTCGLGGGLVAMHVAYMKCGLFGAMPLNILLSAIVAYCVCILVWSAQKLYGRVQMHSLTYPDVMEAAMLLSPWPEFRKVARGSRYLVEITLLCHLCGTCCVLIIMIALNLKELGTGYRTIIDDENPPVRLIVMALIVPCLVICMVTDLKSFAPFALICDLFGVALVLVTLWYSLHDINEDRMNQVNVIRSVPGLIDFSCVSIFALETVCYALPIENSMEQPEIFHFVILTAMPIFTVAMMAVGFFGYWCFGEYSEAPITIHFPCSPFAVTLKVFLCISLYVVYALCFYLAFDLVWFYLRRVHAPTRYWFWERVYRALLVVALVLMAGGLPIDVVRIMGILGALTTTPAIFIYPPFINLLVNWEHPGLGRHKFRLITSISIMFLGFLLIIAGTYCNVISLITESSLNPIKHPPLKMTYWGRRLSNTDFNGTDLKYDLPFNKTTGNLPDDKSMLSYNRTKLRNENVTSLLHFNTSNVLPIINSTNQFKNNTFNGHNIINSTSQFKNNTFNGHNIINSTSQFKRNTFNCHNIINSTSQFKNNTFNGHNIINNTSQSKNKNF